MRSRSLAQFLKTFLAACKDCGVDIVAVHVYNGKGRSPAVGLQKLQAHLDAVHAVVGDIPLAVTEFGNRVAGRQAQVDFMKGAVKLMRRHPWVVIAGAFVHLDEGPLVDDDGKINAVRLALLRRR